MRTWSRAGWSGLMRVIYMIDEINTFLEKYTVWLKDKSIVKQIRTDREEITKDFIPLFYNRIR
jgi:hypothetical protein